MQELTPDRIFAHLAEIEVKVAALDLSHDRSNEKNADLLYDVLGLLDVDFRAFTGSEMFWENIRKKSRGGKAVFDPSLSSSNDQLLISVDRIITKQSGSGAEADQLIRLVHSLSKIGMRSSTGDPATVYTIRPQFALESYNATLAYETFRVDYDAKKLQRERLRSTAKTAARLLAVLSVSWTIYGHSVDALSAGQVFEHLKRVATIVEHLDPGFPTGNQPSGTGPSGPLTDGPSATNAKIHLPKKEIVDDIEVDKGSGVRTEEGSGPPSAPGSAQPKFGPGEVKDFGPNPSEQPGNSEQGPGSIQPLGGG